MPMAGTIRFAPMVREMGTTVQMWTTGIPARSISFTIVAPLRVQVPHVAVSYTHLDVYKRQLVVWAIREGQSAARAVDACLMGYTNESLPEHGAP